MEEEEDRPFSPLPPPPFSPTIFQGCWLLLLLLDFPLSVMCVCGDRMCDPHNSMRMRKVFASFVFFFSSLGNNSCLPLNAFLPAAVAKKKCSDRLYILQKKNFFFHWHKVRDVSAPNQQYFINFRLGSCAEILFISTASEHTIWCQTCKDVSAMCIYSIFLVSVLHASVGGWAPARKQTSTITATTVEHQVE